MDNKKKIFTLLEQTSIVFFFFACSLATIFITNNIKPIGVSLRVDRKLLERQIICNTNYHINVIVVTFVVGHLLCAVPAYRGRNLPSVFREAMMIVYISFICVISFSAMFPINMFQKRLEHRVCVHWIVFHFNALVVQFVLYGWKCFVMVFQPHRNTRSYIMSSLRKNESMKLSGT